MLYDTRDELDDGVDDNDCTSKLTNASRQVSMSRQMRRDNNLRPHMIGQQPPPVTKEMQFAQALSLMVHNDTMRDLNLLSTSQPRY